jgi:hypothetical protein
MNLVQLSLFLENRPGQLKVPCRILGDAGIDIVTMSLADTAQFGILRLVVRDWERARRVLAERGCVVTATPVLAVEIPDRPGGLADVLERVEQAGLAVEYMYELGTPQRGSRAMMVMRFEDADSAALRLSARGVVLLSYDDVFARLGGRP